MYVSQPDFRVRKKKNVNSITFQFDADRCPLDHLLLRGAKQRPHGLFTRKDETALRCGTGNHPECFFPFISAAFAFHLEFSTPTPDSRHRRPLFLVPSFGPKPQSTIPPSPLTRFKPSWPSFPPWLGSRLLDRTVNPFFLSNLCFPSSR